MSAFWLYFIVNRGRCPLQSARVWVDIWDMTNDFEPAYQIPSVQWDYLSGVFGVDFDAMYDCHATASSEMDHQDWTTRERLEYYVTACLTSH